MSESIFNLPKEDESLCYSCQLYDRLKGCLGLSDTFFPNYPCPFYKPFPPEPKEPIFTGSDCTKCFAGTGTGGCRALVSKYEDGSCVFFKTTEQYERECRRCDSRIQAYLKAHPEMLDKYYSLKMPVHKKAVKNDV